MKRNPKRHQTDEPIINQTTNLSSSEMDIDVSLQTQEPNNNRTAVKR